MEKISIKVTVNGDPIEAEVAPGLRLLDWLRNDLNLTGTKEGCGEGDCGACTVLMDEQPVNSCLALAVDADGKSVTTIEGLAKSGKNHPLLDAFIQNGAVQCGFCTPGMILNAYGFLRRNPQPSRQEIIRSMENNLCRCGSYGRVIQAIQTAIDLEPAQDKYFYQAGKIYETAGDKANALAAYNSVIKLNPEHQSALDAIQRLSSVDQN